MRRLGQALAFLGLLVGGAAVIAVTVPVHIVGIAWLIGVGLIKLTFAASLGLMAGGAVLQRIARRTEERERLSPSSAP
jgi:hypothetical protein